MVKSDKLNKYIWFLILIVACLTTPMFRVNNLHVGMGSIDTPLNYLPIFIAGFLIALVIFSFKGIKDIFTKTVVPFLMLPGFVFMYMFIYKLTRRYEVRRRYSEMDIKRFFADIPIRITAIKWSTPTYGYMTEFIFGFAVALMVIVLIKTIINKSYRELLKFKPIYLIYLAVPVIIGYADTFINKVYYKLLSPIYQILCSSSSQIDSKRPLIHISTVETIEYTLIFLAVLAFLFFCIEKININKAIAILGMVVSLAFGPLNPYIVKLSYSFKLDFIQNYFGFDCYNIVILMAAIFTISIKRLMKVKK